MWEPTFEDGRVVHYCFHRIHMFSISDGSSLSNPDKLIDDSYVRSRSDSIVRHLEMRDVGVNG